MKLASRFKRFVAYIIDSVLLYVCVGWPVMAILRLIYKNDIVETADINLYQPYVIRSAIATSLIYMLYYAFFESLKYQATPGKVLLKLNVVTNDHHKLSFSQACLRYVLLAVPFMPIMIGFIYSINELEIVAAIIISGSFVVSFILYLIWFLPIYFTKERKCMHDILSGTKVVKVAKK
jgi:uncharacterized RDD family membrane protein YckC